MEAVFQADCNYTKWNEFILKEKCLNTMGYTEAFLKQCGIRKQKKDLSFAVVENNVVLGICPVFVTQEDVYNTISNDSGFLRGPAISSKIDSKKKSKTMDFIMEQVDIIATENNVVKSLYFIDTQPVDPVLGNPFLKYDFFESSINSRIISLEKEEDLIKCDFRKSYKALINKGLKTYHFEVMNKDNANYDLHEIFRATHIKAAGFEVYDKSIYDAQYEQLLNGEATLIAVLFEGKYVQLNYFMHSNHNVYYASAADDPDFSESCDVPLGHCTMWYAIKYFKKIGFRFFEVGWETLTDQFFEQPSEKEKNISYYKSGFGGELYSLYRGIKFYDETVKENEIKELKIKNRIR